MTYITMQKLYQRCQRLIAAGMLPGRDGEPLRLYAYLDLAGLADGTTTATHPGGRTLGGHSPPRWAAA